MAYSNSQYKLKQMEIAYDSLQNLGLYSIAEQIEQIMANENYSPKLVGNKWKFKYNN
jgi:hypothetical protein